VDWGPITGWIAGAIGLASLAYTLWNNHRQNKREVSWQTVVNIPLFGAKPNPEWGTLKVLLGETTLENPRFVSIRLTNTGRTTLKPVDVSIPPTIRFSNSQVMAATVGLLPHHDEVPEVLNNTVTLPSKEFRTDISLLNPGDALTFKFLVDGPDQFIASFQAAGFKALWIAPSYPLSMRDALRAVWFHVRYS
jgi:hypothetical protein